MCTYIYIYIYTDTETCRSNHLSYCGCICIYMYIYLSIYLSIDLSICLSIYLSLYIYMYVCISEAPQVTKVGPGNALILRPVGAPSDPCSPRLCGGGNTRIALKQLQPNVHLSSLMQKKGKKKTAATRPDMCPSPKQSPSKPRPRNVTCT